MTYTMKISDKTKKDMESYFDDKKRIKTPPYAVFQADEADTVVTVYESGKAVFQGVSADIDYEMWKQMEIKNNPKATFEDKKKKDKKDKKPTIKVDKNIYYSTSIGSDEVGTGDYFGPMVVSSCFVKKEDIPYLEEIGVTDSKKLTDEKIIEIAKLLIKKVAYSTYILTNAQFNEMSSKYNMNKMKAILHNKVLLELTKKYKYDYVVVDQFTTPKSYFGYLNESNNVFRDITFMTKGESKSIAVACASIISRYKFVTEFDKLNKSIDIFLPKGAGVRVDEAGVKIVKKYGIDKLNEIAKVSFKNTSKIKEMIK